MAQGENKLYGKYGIYGSLAYDFRPVGNEKAGDYGRTEKVSKKPNRSQRKHISPAGFVAVILCALFLLCGIMSQSKLIAISDESYALRQEIDELREEQRELKIEHAMAFPLSDTENYAIDILGMQKAASDQIRYIEVSDVNPELSEKSVNKGFRDILSRLREYFPG